MSYEIDVRECPFPFSGFRGVVSRNGRMILLSNHVSLTPDRALKVASRMLARYLERTVK